MAKLYDRFAPCNQKMAIGHMSKIWYPNFVFMNAAADIDYSATKEVPAMVRESSGARTGIGQMIWWQQLIYATTSCKFDVYW